MSTCYYTQRVLCSSGGLHPLHSYTYRVSVPDPVVGGTKEYMQGVDVLRILSLWHSLGVLEDSSLSSCGVVISRR